jgi:hypothetical protein
MSTYLAFWWTLNSNMAGGFRQSTYASIAGPTVARYPGEALVSARKVVWYDRGS